MQIELNIFNTKFTIKNPSDLKYWYRYFNHDRFFDRKTMKFFRDTMSNFYIKDSEKYIILGRKKPVLHQKAGDFAKFSKENLKQSTL